MPPTVVWQIQSHHHPRQLLRLARLLRRGSSGPIVISHDPRAEPLDIDALQAIGELHLVPPPGPPVRGTFAGQIAPYLHVIDWLDRNGVPYDWLINLTGQDYPVTPVAQIESFLDRAGCDGFVRHWDVLSSESPWSRRKAIARYWYRYWRMPDGALPLLRALKPITKVTPLHFYLDYGPLVGMRRLRVPFDENLRCRGGWAFWTLHRSAVRYFREFLQTHPVMVEHYRHCVAPEESLLPTILGGSPLKIVNDDLRYIDYERAQRGSPRTLTIDDMPRFRSGRYHFARKFDPSVDAKILDLIDREIHGL